MLVLKSLLLLVFAIVWLWGSIVKSQLNPFKFDPDPEVAEQLRKEGLLLPDYFSLLPSATVVLIAALLVLTSTFELITGVEIYHPLREIGTDGAWELTGSLFEFGLMLAGLICGLRFMRFSPSAGLGLAVYAFMFWYLGGWEMMSEGIGSVPPWSWFAWIPG